MTHWSKEIYCVYYVRFFKEPKMWNIFPVGVLIFLYCPPLLVISFLPLVVVSPYLFYCVAFFNSSSSPPLPPWHIWITDHFADCALKKVKHSLPYCFSYWCKSQKPNRIGWNGSWSKMLWSRKRKLSKSLLCLVHAQADLTFEWRNTKL